MKNYYEEKVKNLIENSKDYTLKSLESEKVLSPKSAWKGLDLDKVTVPPHIIFKKMQTL
jgi:hypothetical protein